MHLIWFDGTTWHDDLFPVHLRGRPAIATVTDGSIWLIGVLDSGWIVAYDISPGGFAGDWAVVGRAVPGWEVALDSRGLAGWASPARRGGRDPTFAGIGL